MTELLGFDANAEEHKVQWLSVRGDARYQDLFLEILNLSDAAAPRPSFFSTERLKNGGFGRGSTNASGSTDGEPVPESLRAAHRRGHAKALENAVIRMAGGGRQCVPGRRLGPQRAAGLRPGKSLGV